MNDTKVTFLCAKAEKCGVHLYKVLGMNKVVHVSALNRDKKFFYTSN